MVEDFNRVLEVLPENQENIKEEHIQQKRMEKYTHDLIACARGELLIDDLKIPESSTPWTPEQIDAEIERIKINPTRLDNIKDFKNFLGREADNIQQNAKEFSGFAIQQAWNYTASGPVGEAATAINAENSYPILLRSGPTRPPWNPKPQVLQTLMGHTD